MSQLFSSKTRSRMLGLALSAIVAATAAVILFAPPLVNAEIISAPDDPVTLVGPPVPKLMIVEPAAVPPSDEGTGVLIAPAINLSEEVVNLPIEHYAATSVDTRARTLITVRAGANGAIILDPPELVDSLVSIIDNSGCVTFINDKPGAKPARWNVAARLKGSGCALLMVTDGQPVANISANEDADMVAAAR